MSNVTLVLNADAMDALFPKGSEARLVLATAAIKKMAETAIKPTMVSDGVMAVIEKQRKLAVVEVLKSLHDYNGWGKVDLNERFTHELKQQATVAVNAACSAAINEAVSNALDGVVYRVENMLLKRITAATTTKVNEAVQQIVEQYTTNIIPK